jgi:hypothetical protein
MTTRWTAQEYARTRLLPAIESAHVVGARDWARRNPNKRVLVGLSVAATRTCHAAEDAAGAAGDPDERDDSDSRAAAQP